MTSLDTFECSNCGAKVKRPATGATTACPYCDAELVAPQPAAPVVVREIVRERVIERAPPVVDFSAPSQRSPRKTLAIILGILFVGFIVIMAILSSAKQDSDQLHASFKARESCEQTCKQGCAKQFAAADPAPAGDAAPDDFEREREAKKSKRRRTCEL